MNRFLALPLALGLLVSGCQTPAQKQFWKGAASGALTVTQVVANAAISAVLIKAGSNQDLTKKGNALDSAALALRTLQGRTAGVVTPELIAGTVLQFTDPTKVHWSVLADSIASSVATSPLPVDQALEQAATGLNKVAASTR